GETSDFSRSFGGLGSVRRVIGRDDRKPHVRLARLMRSRRQVYSTVKVAARHTVLFPAESDACTSSRYSPDGSLSIATSSHAGMTGFPACFPVSTDRKPVSDLTSPVLASLTLAWNWMFTAAVPPSSGSRISKELISRSLFRKCVSPAGVN